MLARSFISLHKIYWTLPCLNEVLRLTEERRKIPGPVALHQLRLFYGPLLVHCILKHLYMAVRRRQGLSVSISYTIQESRIVLLLVRLRGASTFDLVSALFDI